MPGFWLGLGMMQTLFSLEHNTIAAMLAAAHPEFDDEMLFQKARLITCALIAKIHTVEWTPSVTAHPTAVEGLYANWWGLAGQKLHDFVAKISKNEALRGIPGTGTEDFGVPYALTEEFVAVYRMHPLVPDDFDFRSARDDARTLGPRSFTELTGPQAAPDPAGPAADRHHLHVRHDESRPGQAAQFPERAADVPAAGQRRVHGHGSAGHPAVP